MKNHPITIVLIFCLILGVLSRMVQAQGHEPSTTYEVYWGSLGLGMVAMSELSGGGFGGSLRAVYGWDGSCISASAQGGGTMYIFGTNDDVSVFNICYGGLLFEQSMLFRFSAGPAYLKRHRASSGFFSDNLTQLDINQFGISAEAEGMFRYRFFGIGLALSFAAAKNITMGAFVFNVTFGKLE